jgi:ribosomal protein S18 acetylase RimI-like enzyme
MDQLRLRPVLPTETMLLKDYVRDYYRYDQLLYSSKVETALHLLVTDNSLGLAWFIVLGDLTCGYVILTSGFDCEYGGKFGLITDFFLLEEYRGRGIGKQALQLVIDEATSRGFQAIELAVTHKNDRAKALYRSMEFEPLLDRSTMLRNLTVS